MEILPIALPVYERTLTMRNSNKGQLTMRNPKKFEKKNNNIYDDNNNADKNRGKISSYLDLVMVSQ